MCFLFRLVHPKQRSKDKNLQPAPNKLEVCLPLDESYFSSFYPLRRMI